jgi:hypothetical protein
MQQIDFQNTSDQTCELTGYPSVMFVDQAGHQVGLAAEPTNLTEEPIGTVSLKPRAFANAAFGAPNPGGYQSTPELSSSTCRPKRTADLRVVLPGEQRSYVLRFEATVCTTPDAAPLVTPFRPGRAPTAVA